VPLQSDLLYRRFAYLAGLEARPDGRKGRIERDGILYFRDLFAGREMIDHRLGISHEILLLSGGNIGVLICGQGMLNPEHAETNQEDCHYYERRFLHFSTPFGSKIHILFSISSIIPFFPETGRGGRRKNHAGVQLGLL
jgi:hypothetical protein